VTAPLEHFWAATDERIEAVRIAVESCESDGEDETAAVLRGLLLDDGSRPSTPAEPATCATCQHWDSKEIWAGDANEPWSKVRLDDTPHATTREQAIALFGVGNPLAATPLPFVMVGDAQRFAAEWAAPPQVDLMLPCPFCGAAAGLILERHPQSGGGGHRCVRCGECGAIGPASRTQAGAAGEREATANWNRRVEGRGKR
jgi:Lar family restriction alleviation protein